MFNLRGRARGKHNGRGVYKSGQKHHGDPASDSGCTYGDPANNILPWSNSEELPDLARLHEQLLMPNASQAAGRSYISRPLRKCAIVVDRHVHKNGGSSIRDLFLEHERTGHALYQGYTQMYWNRDYRLLRRAAEEALSKHGRAPEHVLLMEAHFGWVEMSSTLLPSLRELSQLYADRGVDCPLVLMTRVREPLDYYLSFYKWGVAFRQRESPQHFGRNFLEWAEKVPNLQSTMMIQSMAAMAAEYHIDQYKMHYNMNNVIGKTPELAWEKLIKFLDQFTIVATMQRFDESLLLAHDLVGLPILEYKRNRPNQKGGYRGTNKDACPDMEACRKLIARVADRDHKMYARYNERFEAKLKDLGPAFEKRVQAYKAAIAAIQPTWRKVPRKQYLCRYHPETSANVPLLRKHNIRCPVADGGPELCQSIYAHRLFECPWQYRPNSTLSDSLGCWRPSTGFKR